MDCLTINTGSSSLKSAIYRIGGEQSLQVSATIERIGFSDSHICVVDSRGTPLYECNRPLPDHATALEALMVWLQHQDAFQFEAIGHRVVHGGADHSKPQRISDDLIVALRQLIAIDPIHLPQAIGAIETVSRLFPTVPQVACFDTAFHRQMPRVAQLYALPRWVEDAGVVRYGFHGLSYEYIMQELRSLDAVAAAGRIIIAHLGNGASMAAVRDGIGIETTMGFTPTGGLVMGTRSGDLDPGVPLYLLQSHGLDAAALNALVNQQAGLLGLSGSSADMHDLLDRERSDKRAADAVELFCYTARKYVGALAAALGGLDTMVFTAGIGQHAAPVRERICTGLGFLGIDVDGRRNAKHAPVISRNGAPVTIRVMHTNEDLMIARHTYHLIAQ